MYSKLEVAAIFAHCKVAQEVFDVCARFKELEREFGIRTPPYVRLWAALRHRHILLKNKEI